MVAQKEIYPFVPGLVQKRLWYMYFSRKIVGINNKVWPRWELGKWTNHRKCGSAACLVKMKVPLFFFKCDFCHGTDWVVKYQQYTSNLAVDNHTPEESSREDSHSCEIDH